MLKAPSKVLPSLPPPYSTALAPTIHEGQRMIDARGLHGWLGNKERFNQWVARRITDFVFEEGSDYYRNLGIRSDGKAGRRATNYLLTIGMAKELAMLERSNIGSQVRRYFIEMEQSAIQAREALVEAGTPELVNQSYHDAIAVRDTQMFSMMQEACMVGLASRIHSTSGCADA